MKVHRLNQHGEIELTGERNGKRIFLTQTVVHKMNEHYTIFAQFPARIYVDGQFTPEAKYKAMFA